MADADATTFRNEVVKSDTTKQNDPLETAKWTRYLPETFGIREAVRQSSYRWCVREGYVGQERMHHGVELRVVDRSRVEAD